MLTQINTVDNHSSYTGSHHILHHTQPLPPVVLPLFLFLIIVWVRTKEFFHLRLRIDIFRMYLSILMMREWESCISRIYN